MFPTVQAAALRVLSLMLEFATLGEYGRPYDPGEATVGALGEGWEAAAGGWAEERAIGAGGWAAVDGWAGGWAVDGARAGDHSVSDGGDVPAGALAPFSVSPSTRAGRALATVARRSHPCPPRRPRSSSGRAAPVRRGPPAGEAPTRRPDAAVDVPSGADWRARPPHVGPGPRRAGEAAVAEQLCLCLSPS